MPRQHTNTKTLAQPETPIQKTNIGVPKDVWISVRKLAIDRGVNAEDIYVEGARKVLAEQ